MARTPMEKAPDPDLGTELIPKERYTSVGLEFVPDAKTFSQGANKETLGLREGEDSGARPGRLIRGAQPARA